MDNAAILLFLCLITLIVTSFGYEITKGVPHWEVANAFYRVIILLSIGGSLFTITYIIKHI